MPFYGTRTGQVYSRGLRIRSSIKNRKNKKLKEPKENHRLLPPSSFVEEREDVERSIHRRMDHQCT